MTESPAPSPNTRSDDVMRRVFEHAAAAHQPARFLRLGCPREFREQIIRGTENGGFTEAMRLLVNPAIPRVEFVLADPRFAPFLSRMDAEGKESFDIWRVRAEVLAFAKGLLKARTLRQRTGRNSLLVAFHGKQLLWNLSIGGADLVVVRAYFRATSGHDDRVEEVVLSAGERSRMAESMVAYFDSIRDDASTIRVEQENDLEEFWSWPSLLKANAIETAIDPTGGTTCLKTVTSAETRNFEAAWLDTRDSEAEACRWFRPVSLRHASSLQDADYGGHRLEMEHVKGVTAEELLFQIQRLATARPDLRNHLQELADAAVGQAIVAVNEFQQIWRRMGPARGLQGQVAAYPWQQQLTAAFQEVSPFLSVDPATARSFRQFADEAALALKPAASEPFRDAHLKNRLIQFPPEWFDAGQEGLIRWLTERSRDDVPESVRQLTVDIDFETSRFLVTPFEDALHVLTCPNLGWKSDHLLNSGCRSLRDWWPSASDIHLIRLNLLCRSFREMCRRIWYANVMPRTFARRYRTEPQQHFLGLFRTVAPYFPQWPVLQRMAHQCEDEWNDLVPAGTAPRWEEPIVVQPPLKTAPAPSRDAIQVFLSCHSRDYPHAATVYEYLKARSIPTFFCEQTLPGLGNTNFRKTIYQALDVCRHMIVIARSGERVRDNWVEAEWGFFLNEKNSGRKKGNIVTLTLGPIPVTELPPELRGFEIIAAPESGPDTAVLSRLLGYVQE